MSKPDLISIERKKAIYVIRGQKVMLDRDLAELYQVQTKALNQAVRRNLDRFPADFMFQLLEKEVVELNRSQFVTGSQKHREGRATLVMNRSQIVIGSQGFAIRVKINLQLATCFFNGYEADLRRQIDTSKQGVRVARFICGDWRERLSLLPAAFTLEAIFCFRVTSKLTA